MTQLQTTPLFDNYEISGCKEFSDGRGGSYIEPVEDSEASFWTLYGHVEGQGVTAIGNFRTRKIAESIYFRIVGKPFTASYDADPTMRVRHAAHQMLTALEFALPYMEDLAGSGDNKSERCAAKLMRNAIFAAHGKPEGECIKYRVVVSVLTRETWDIEAEHEAEARANWEEGCLRQTDCYKMQEILSVTEIPESGD